MNNPQEVAEIIKSIAKSKNMPVKTMLTNCDVSKNTVDNMLKGSMPSADKLAKIALYLDVSMEYLLGLERNDNNEQ